MASGYQLGETTLSLFVPLLLAVLGFLLELALQPMATSASWSRSAFTLHFGVNGLHARLRIERSVNRTPGQESDVRGQHGRSSSQQDRNTRPSELRAHDGLLPSWNHGFEDTLLPSSPECKLSKGYVPKFSRSGNNLGSHALSVT